MPKMNGKRMRRAVRTATGTDGEGCALGALDLCGEVRSAWFKTR